MDKITITKKEIDKQFNDGKFSSKIKYYVNVEGHEFTTEFNYGGFCECLEFIHKHGISEKRYEIQIIEEE